MKRTQVLLTTLAVSAALAVTGCGGDDTTDGSASSTPTSTPTTAAASETAAISTEDFTTQANAICVAGNADLAAAAQEVGDQPTDAQIEAFATDTLIPNIQAQHDDIEALGAPEESADDVGAMLDSLQGALDTVAADPSLLAGDTDPFAAASELAGGLGLPDCAS